MTELADKSSIETALNSNKTRQTIENTEKTAASQPTAAALADVFPAAAEYEKEIAAIKATEKAEQT